MRTNCIDLLIGEYGPLLKDCRSGHRWVLIGGRACEFGLGHSHLVYECEVCGDCDYGDSNEAREDCENIAETSLCYL